MLKKKLLEILDNTASKRIDTRLKEPQAKIVKLVKMILDNRGEPYRLPFIRGIIVIGVNKGRLAYHISGSMIMRSISRSFSPMWTPIRQPKQ